MAIQASTLLMAGVLAFALAACGVLRPDHGTGAADIAVTEGGLAGAAEGSPGNAENLGSNGSIILPGFSHGR